MEKKLSRDTIIEGKVVAKDTVILIGEANTKKAPKRRKESKPKDKKLKESENLEFSVVYVNSMDSAVVSLNEKNSDNVGDIRAEAHKRLLAQNPDASDDFWIDDIWNDSGIEADVNWKDILAPGGILDQTVVDYVFENPEEFGVKMQFYLDQGNRINPSSIEEDLEDITVYDADMENWVEGNYQTRIPEGWLGDHVEEMGWMTGIIEDHYAYFEEGFARIVSDYEPNGEMSMDKIGDYFVYKYN